jgi:hypothetical protein
VTESVFAACILIAAAVGWTTCYLQRASRVNRTPPVPAEHVTAQPSPWEKCGCKVLRDSDGHLALRQCHKHWLATAELDAARRDDWRAWAREIKKGHHR